MQPAAASKRSIVEIETLSAHSKHSRPDTNYNGGGSLYMHKNCKGARIEKGQDTRGRRVNEMSLLCIYV